MKTSKTVSIRSTAYFLLTTPCRLVRLKSSIRSIRAHHPTWEICPPFLEQSLGHATYSTASVCRWNNSHQNYPSFVNTRSQSSNLTRLVTLCSPMSIFGVRNGPSRSKKQKLVFKPLLSFATQTTTSSMLTSTLRFLLSFLKLSAWVVLVSIFLSLPRLSCSKKKNSSTTTTNFSLC